MSMHGRSLSAHVAMGSVTAEDLDDLPWPTSWPPRRRPATRQCYFLVDLHGIAPGAGRKEVSGIFPLNFRSVTQQQLPFINSGQELVVLIVTE